MVDKGCGAIPGWEREHTSPEKVKFGFPLPASTVLTGIQHDGCLVQLFISSFLMRAGMFYTPVSTCLGVGMHINKCLCVWRPGLRSEIILDCSSVLLTETRPLNQAQNSPMWLVSLVSLRGKTLVSFGGWDYRPLPHLTHGFRGSKTKSSSIHTESLTDEPSS